MRERLLASRIVFEGKILRLRVDEVEAADGHRGTREVVEHAGAVGIVVVHEGQIVLVRQYRHACGEDLLEIPAGKLAYGEDPEAAAHRELVEEVSLRAGRMEHLLTYYSTPGFTDEEVHLYLAHDTTPLAGRPDPGEVLTVERHPVSRLGEILRSGEIRDAKTIVGLSLLAVGNTR